MVDIYIKVMGNSNCEVKKKKKNNQPDYYTRSVAKSLSLGTELRSQSIIIVMF